MGNVTKNESRFDMDGSRMKNRLGKCEMKLVHFAMLYVPVIALFTGWKSAAETKSMKACPVKVCYSCDAGFHEQLAAKEIRRYVYLRTGTLPAIQKTDSVPKSQDVIVIAKKRCVNELS